MDAVLLNSTQRCVEELLNATRGKVDLGPYDLGRVVGWATIIRENTLELQRLSNIR